jgi:hypothetical protein
LFFDILLKNDLTTNSGLITYTYDPLTGSPT